MSFPYWAKFAVVAVWLQISWMAYGQTISEGLNPLGINLPTKTLGGQQYWTNVRFEGGWHIQQNQATGHFRLLDPADVRQAWGTQSQCEAALQSLVENKQIEPYSGRVVILLHGLNRSHHSMVPLAKKLRSEYGFHVINFQYASSLATVQTHAEALAGVIEALGPEVSEIHFVAHSLGNLVIRNYLYQRQNLDRGHCRDPRLTRMVMFGPPNQGSRLARRLAKDLTFNAVAGVSGKQLSQDWAQLEAELAVPNFPFAIIAGGSEEANWVERAVFAGPSDLVVSVAETQLRGAARHTQLPLTHTFMMQDPQAMQIAAEFLGAEPATPRR